MASSPRPIISVQDLHKSFGPKTVLDGVNLDVGKGESLVIIGGSGTGKSVTIKCIQGLLTPDQGRIEINGENVIGMAPADRERVNSRIGMLFQAAALFDSLPVWENVAFGLLSEGRANRADARDMAIEKLALVGLDASLADLSPADLSGGMQKRVGLARAIANDPEIIFFDEPTTGLDPIMADIINDLIVAVNQKIGATALTITHDMQSAKKIGDRIAMLYQGKIIWAGPADAIDDSGNPYVDQFIHGRVEGPIKMALRA
ncbi:MAG: ATP-binding cassette domain-containing protein [Rhodospirillales bacterium]|nr:ATP-binding cassette domain-containing protein [Rhodospirillales bacterium]